MEAKSEPLGKTIEFEIPGRAVGKSAPKFRVITGRDGKPIQKNGHWLSTTYYPKDTKEWLAFVRDLAKRVAPPEPWTCPVEVTIAVHRRPPQSWNAKQTNLALTGNIYPTSRPDCDNYSKGVCDGLEKAGIFKDDAQVVDLHVLKFYGPVEETRVTIRPLGETATQPRLL